MSSSATTDSPSVSGDVDCSAMNSAASATISVAIAFDLIQNRSASLRSSDASDERMNPVDGVSSASATSTAARRSRPRKRWMSIVAPAITPARITRCCARIARPRLNSSRSTSIPANRKSDTMPSTAKILTVAALVNAPAPMPSATPIATQVIALGIRNRSRYRETMKIPKMSRTYMTFGERSGMGGNVSHRLAARLSPVGARHSKRRHRMYRSVLLVPLLAIAAACTTAKPAPAPAVVPEPALADNAPTDEPVGATAGSVSAMGKMLAPCVTKARAAFPGAAQRFKAGLPEGQSLFVVTVLHDSTGKFEQVFVAVDSIGKTDVYGRIWNQITIVKGYQLRQPYTVPQGEIIDWMISKPDGSEEGNWSGKFLDAWRATGKAPTGIC